MEREPYHERLNNEDRIRRKEQEEKQHRFEEEQRRKKQVEQLKIAESQIPEETHTNKEERLEEKAEVVPEKIAKHASLMNSKELMSGYDWKTKGNTVAAEKKLLSELHSIDAVCKSKKSTKGREVANSLKNRQIYKLQFILRNKSSQSLNILIDLWRN